MLPKAKITATGTRIVVHGDDFTFLGAEEDLRRIAAKMEEWLEVKVRGILGTDPEDEKEMVILNRVIKITEEDSSTRQILSTCRY